MKRKSSTRLPRQNEFLTFSGHVGTLRTVPICLEDIAHGLSQVCRWSGQIPVFYSVAEHSLDVAAELKKQNCSAFTQLAGLLHDAHEAYISDLVVCVKSRIRGYKEMEKYLQKRIEIKLLGREVPDGIKELVKEVDREIWKTEVRGLWHSKEEFFCFPWNRLTSKIYFINKFNELQIGLLT